MPLCVLQGDLESFQDQWRMSAAEARTQSSLDPNSQRQNVAEHRRRLTVFIGHDADRRWRTALRLLQFPSPSLGLSMGHLLRLSCGDSSNQAAIESSTQQDSIRHLGHQPLAHGLFECLAEELEVARSGRDRTLRSIHVAVPPRRLVIAPSRPITAVVNMSRRE